LVLILKKKQIKSCSWSLVHITVTIIMWNLSKTNNDSAIKTERGD